MNKKLRKILDEIKIAIDNRNYYFQFAQDEIATQNIKRIHQCSIICLVLGAILVVITPMIYPAWHLSSSYLALFVFMILSCIGSSMGMKRKEIRYKPVIAMATIFYMFFQLMLIYIDVVENQNDEAIYFPFILVVLPIIQVLPVTIVCVMNISLEIVFAATLFAFRIDDLVINDLYTSLFALVLSIIVANLVMNLRCEDNVAKFRYKRLSSVDILTSALNKATSEALSEEYIKNRKTHEAFALLVLDVDNFKMVNDNLGHQAGDVILQKVGHILLDSFRDEDIVGRVGGDEFLVLMKNITNRNMVDERCKEVNERIHRLTGNNPGTPISCSIGAVLIRNNHLSYERCFSMSDDALYDAKKSGRNCYVLREETQPENYKKPVMIVADDDEVNRAVIQETFQNEYDVVQAKDGTETLSFVSKYYSSVAVILLDIHMPNTDGYQVIKFMKARPKYKNIPIIVISGYSENELQALELGIEDVIVKPFNPDVAKLRVANVVRTNKIE